MSDNDTNNNKNGLVVCQLSLISSMADEYYEVDSRGYWQTNPLRKRNAKKKDTKTKEQGSSATENQPSLFTEGV